jgi:hypothetical protein
MREKRYIEEGKSNGGWHGCPAPNFCTYMGPLPITPCGVLLSDNILVACCFFPLPDLFCVMGQMVVGLSRGRMHGCAYCRDAGALSSGS